MRKSSVLYTVTSWEPRFKLGLERFLDTHEVNKMVMLYMDEFKNRTTDVGRMIRTKVRRSGIEVVEHSIFFDSPAKTWKTLFELTSAGQEMENNPFLDLTTMPREVIWTLLDLLVASRKREVGYVYNCPAKYNAKWLSRDPAKPRIVYKLGGEARLGLGTALLILAGYDLQRIKQLVRFFEPQVLLLGLQTGDQFNNQTNVEAMRGEFRDESNVHFFEVDAYSDDHGYSTISDEIRPYLKTYNIIASSLGPKLSAMSLYRIHSQRNEVALAYAPSREFNRNYSSGLGRAIEGAFKPTQKAKKA